MTMLSKQHFFSKFTLNQLFSLGAHVGHLRRRLNKSMSVFLLGFRNGLVCIDLNFTIFFLRRAVNFLRMLLKSRGSVFFFISNWGPLQRYFRARFFTRMHLWYSGPFLGGLLSNLRSVRYSPEARAFGNFFRTRILVPDTTILFDSTNFFYVYRDAFLLGIPSIGFVDTDLDYQNVLYPVVLNNSGVKVNFLYSVFFLNILKQEHCLERFFLVKELPFSGLKKKIYLKKFNRLATFFLYQFLEKSSFTYYKGCKEVYSEGVGTHSNFSLFVRRSLKNQITKFRQLRRSESSLMQGNFPVLKVNQFFFNVLGLLSLHKVLVPGGVVVDRYKYDGRVVLQRLRKTRTRFFFVKSRLSFLRRNFNKILKFRKLNFMKLRILLKLYREYLTVTLFSRRSLFGRLLKKLVVPVHIVRKLSKMRSLVGVFNFLRFYFLKKEHLCLRRLRYVSTRILTLLGSSRRKTSVMVSRLGDSFAFNQSVLSKDFYTKRRFVPAVRAKIIRKIKLKGGFLVIKRHLFRKKGGLLKFPDGFDVKDAKRLRLRHARNMIEAKAKYYISRRTLYDYNNLLNSRFKVEHSMFKNLSGLVKKGLFRRSKANDHYALRHTKKPLVIYSEINPKTSSTR